MKNVILIFLSLFILSLEEEEKVWENKCHLTKDYPVNPFPNLEKCYKYNEASCCTILHDNMIKDITESFLPEPCLRKYPELEDLLCLPCSPYESNYLDHDKKTFKVCLNFALKVWDKKTKEELNQNSTRFDNCGFIVVDEMEKIKALDSDGLGFIIPSFAFHSFSEFINKIEIPFYKGYTVEIVESEDEKDCFNSSFVVNVNIFMMVVLLLMLS